MRPPAIFLYDSVSNSLTPFLYHTRTLSTTTCSKIRSVHNTKFGCHTPRLFSCGGRWQYADNDASNTQERGLDGQSLTIKRVSTPDPKARVDYERESRHDRSSRRRIPEYNGSHRAILKDTRSVGRAAAWQDFDLGDGNDGHSRRSEEIEFDEVPGTDDYALSRDEIADLTKPTSVRESTITDTERYAFQKIFSDIFGRQQSMGSVQNDSHSDRLQSTDDTAPSDLVGAPHKPEEVSNGATKTQRQPETRQEMQILVNKFPPALRAAAAKAIGLTDAEAAEEDFQDPMSTSLSNQNLEALREPERTRVEALMKAAKTDFELWDIMKMEVFSLIPKLGLGDPLSSATLEVGATDPAGKAEQKKQGKNKKSAKGKSTANSKNTEIPVKSEPFAADSPRLTSPESISENDVSPLALYGPLYPSYLLLGLRLLDRSFSKSSPLALTILPTIKSLGLISQVLGASTQLYNEVIRIHQHKYDDYRSILKLLNEMENSGLEFDEETFDIVREIQGTQYRVREGLEGAAMKALWRMPEFTPNKFQIWVDKIGMAIEEKRQNGQI